jgi:hypothetical protein
MRRFLVFIAASAFIAAACSPTTIPARQTGVLNLKDTTDGSGPGGGYVVKPQGVFWKAQNIVIPNSTIVPDSCIDTVYFPPDTSKSHLINSNLDAGSPLQVSTSTGIGTMAPDTIPGVIIIYYALGWISHVPGTDITYTIPGAAGGFESGTIHGKTPTKLLLGPIDPQPADSLYLTWNSDLPGTSAVNIALIYKTPGSGVFDHQILCSLFDDGKATVIPKDAAKWAAAYPNQKVAALRWITTFETLPKNSLLVAISEFDTVKTTFP